MPYPSAKCYDIKHTFCYHVISKTACSAVQNGEKIISVRSAREVLGESGDDLPQTDDAAAVIISGTSFHTISILGDGELDDVTIRQHGPGNWFAVLCSGGASPTLTRCRIDGATSSCVGITEGSAPNLVKCSVSGSQTGAGICVFGGGKGTLNECEVHNNAKSGVEVTGEESETTIENSEIHRNRGDGVLVMNEAKCTLTTNKIHHNYHSGAFQYSCV